MRIFRNGNVVKITDSDHKAKRYLDLGFKEDKKTKQEPKVAKKTNKKGEK